MAWNAPMTAVASSNFTAQQYNEQIRDNLALMAPALATTAGRTFNVTANHELHETEIKYAEAAGSNTTTSDTFVSITNGPSLTATIYGQQAMVWFTAQIDQDTSDMQGACTIEVSGATSYVADNARCCITRDGMPSGNPIQMMATYLFDPLNQGSHTFTAKYRTGGAGTATFSNRRLMVWPL